MIERKIYVCESLRLDSLRCVNDKKRAFARRKRTRHFVRKVNVSRSVDKVEHVFLALIIIKHSASLQFYGNAPFALDIHVVEELFFHIPVRHGIGAFDKTVGESALAVVDVGYYAKIADFRVFKFH